MSLISGEYWIDDSGNATFADGDVGDAGHEMIAFETALGLNLEDFRDIQFYAGSIPITVLAKKYLKDKNSEFTIDDLADMESKDEKASIKNLGVESKYADLELETALAYQWLDDNGANMKFVDWCEGSLCDARDYALEHMNWIRVKNDNFEVWKFTDDALSNIKNSEVFPEEDYDGYDISESDAEVGISERSTGWYETVPVKVLLKAKSAEGLKNYVSGIGKFHRSVDNPNKAKECHEKMNSKQNDLILLADQSEKYKDLDSRNRYARELLAISRIVKSNNGASVETSYDRQSRNWATFKNASDNTFEIEYTGNKDDAAVAHFWAAREMLRSQKHKPNPKRRSALR